MASQGDHDRVNPFVAHASGADETMSLVMLFAGIWVGWIGWSRLRGTGFSRLPRWGAWATIAAAVTLVITATFVPRMIVGPATPTAVAGAPRPSSPAKLAFVAPKPNAKESGDDMTVQINLQNATLTPLTTTAITPDTGHIHLSMDGSLISMSGDTLQVIDLRNVSSGEHTLTADFVAADHLPFDPPVTTTITFERTSG
ncbi:MAG TPA: hypothetical protein VJ736_11315 [Actinomycetota bacterium]|nr:hypothetical protein [Actinomycetota bacterium]